MTTIIIEKDNKMVNYIKEVIQKMTCTTGKMKGTRLTGSRQWCKTKEKKNGNLDNKIEKGHKR